MALWLPRERRATSLATRPRTLSVASITNHSCTTSAGFALKVDMRFLFKRRVCRALFHGRRSSDGNLLGGDLASPRSHKSAAKHIIIRDSAKSSDSRLAVPLTGEFITAGSSRSEEAQWCQFKSLTQTSKGTWDASH